MNLIERKIHGALRGNPRLKSVVRNLYQSLFDILPVIPYRASGAVKTVDGYFYGFHDHSPFSVDGEKLLVHKAPEKKFMPKVGDEIELGYLTGGDYRNFVPIGKTNTWNWHMGSKMQWVGTHNEVSFNDFTDGPRVRIVNVETGQQRSFPGFMSAISPDGSQFVGYDFLRVERLMPGYGYKTWDIASEIAATEGGLSIGDTQSGVVHRFFDMNEISQISPDGTMQDAYHFVSHANFSPDGRKVSFLHRWLPDTSNPALRYTRLIVASLNSGELTILPTSGLVSHYCWRDPDSLIAFCSTDQLGIGYHIFSLKADAKSQKVEFLEGINEDGHPMVGSASSFMITDTYPNRRRMKSLYLYNLEKKFAQKVGEFYMPKEFQSPDAFHHWCCDLHPRWDRSGKYVCFDTAFSGTRSITIMNVSDFLD
jgi:hypothetical protein